MRKFILFIFLISFSAYSQTNRFTGTWSTENCKDCSKDYILTMNIAQSNGKIFGTAEIISDKAEFKTDVMEVSGYVSTLGEKANITLKAKNNLSASVTIYVNETTLQFNKRGGADLVPKEAFLTKLY